MPLTEVARYIRNGVKWGIVALIGYIALRIFLAAAIHYYNIIFPAPPLPPTIAFGKLPQVQVPGKSVALTGVEIILDTIEATPPATPNVLAVYRMPQPDPNLLKLDQAKKIANTLGFSTDPIPLSQTEYKFIDSLNPSLELIINIINTNFYLRYDYKKDPSILNQTLVFTRDDAPSKFKEILRRAGMGFEDLINGDSKANYVKISQQNDALKFEDVNSRLDSNAVKVQLFRKKIEDKYPFVQKDPQISYVNGLLIGDDRIREKKTLISIDYNYFPVDLKDSATYPLISSYTAWQSFLGGNGVVVEGGNANLRSLRVTDIYMAYWEPLNYEEYLQPIFVISGKGTTVDGTETPYTSYLPAVSAEYVVQ